MACIRCRPQRFEVQGVFFVVPLAMFAVLSKRYRQYLSFVPCHPTFRRTGSLWALLWNERARAVFARFSFPVSCVLIALSFVAWPYLVLLGALKLRYREGDAEASSSRGRGIFFIRLVVCSFRFRMRPFECYRLGLWQRGGDESDVLDYVSVAFALPLLAYWNDREQVEVLSDKKLFAEFFGARKIRVPSVLAMASAGVLRIDLDWREDVFLKPRWGSRSSGVERWDWNGSAYCKGFGDTVLDEAALRRRLEGLSLDRDYLVQPRLRNHPEIEDLSNGSVIVFRILTVRFKGKTEIVAPVAQLPYDNRVDDVWREWVVAVTVGLESGELGTILGKDESGSRSGMHPSTGARVVGRRVPDWAEGIALLRRAHEALPDVLVVGWDLVFTPEGPCLIEGNSGPALVLHQLGGQEALGRTVFGDALRSRVRGL